MKIEDLLNNNTLTQEVYDCIKSYINDKCNIFICGQCGSGKTTFLNILDNSFFSKKDRIYIDNLNNIKEIRNNLKDFSLNSLQNKKIFIDELENVNFIELLKILNKNNVDLITTIHAYSLINCVRRLILLVYKNENNVKIKDIKEQLLTKKNLVIHFATLSNGERKVIGIATIEDLLEDKIELNYIYNFESKLD